MRSSSTSENPITAFSGVRSSCDMLARKSDLCWLATCSSALLRSSSLKQAGVEHRQRGLAGERLHELQDLVGEVARCLAPDHHGADDLAVAEHRDGENGTPAVLVQQLEVDIPVDLRDVGDPDRASLARGPTDEGLVQVGS